MVVARCGLVFANPQPVPPSLAAHYDVPPHEYLNSVGAGDGYFSQELAWLERLSTRFADRVVVTQELARQLAMRRGVPGEKVTVVLNGPDESIFDPQLRERTGQRDDFTIVTHGLILERFGIQTLLDALPAVASHVPEVRVEIYGDGEFRAALEAQVARNGVADRVHFHGWLPLDEDVAA